MPPVAASRPRSEVAGRVNEPALPTTVVKSRPQTLLAVPLAAAIGLAVHYFVPKR